MWYAARYFSSYHQKDQERERREKKFEMYCLLLFLYRTEEEHVEGEEHVGEGACWRNESEKENERLQQAQPSFAPPAASPVRVKFTLP